MKYSNPSLAIVKFAILAFLIAFCVTPFASAFSPQVQVNSAGVEQGPVLVYVALTGHPTSVFRIQGASIQLRNVNGALKNYFLLAINESQTFNLNLTDTIQTGFLGGFNTNNLYWNVRQPGGRYLVYHTVGQDLDTANGSLSLWQWVHMSISQNGSFDGGGPSACSTYSNGQLRMSVYMLITNIGQTRSYTINEAHLYEEQVGNQTVSVLVVGIASGAPRNGVGRSGTACPFVSNPIDGPFLRWFVRSPPVVHGGNFGVVSTVGMGLDHPATKAIQFLQFVDENHISGFMQAGPTCATCLS